MGTAVDVCVCTHDRLSVLTTLESLAVQALPPGLAMRVIVADNNRLPLSRAPIEAAARRLALDLVYVHAPADNISIARNACLAAARAPWIAFIDDDEVAAPDWLAPLVAAGGGRDVVLAPVRALYPAPGTPRWMIEGDFHSTGHGPTDRADKGYCGNVLLRRAFVEANGARFDPALGRIGGEDTQFFRWLHARGARFARIDDALVYEEAGAERATLAWLLKRRYRTGQIHLLLAEGGAAARRRIAAGALAKLVASGGMAALSVADRRRAAGWLLRGAFHAGVVAAWAGRSVATGYGAAGAGQGQQISMQLK